MFFIIKQARNPSQQGINLFSPEVLIKCQNWIKLSFIKVARQDEKHLLESSCLKIIANQVICYQTNNYVTLRQFHAILKRRKEQTQND